MKMPPWQYSIGIARRSQDHFIFSAGSLIPTKTFLCSNQDLLHEAILISLSDACKCYPTRSGKCRKSFPKYKKIWWNEKSNVRPYVTVYLCSWNEDPMCSNTSTTNNMTKLFLRFQEGAISWAWVLQIPTHMCYLNITRCVLNAVYNSLAVSWAVEISNVHVSEWSETIQNICKVDWYLEQCDSGGYGWQKIAWVLIAQFAT